MNNEIKEILNFKENADYKRLSIDEIIILKDYITNLQQENEKLSDKVEFYEDVDSDRCAYNEELQQENERLKEENNNKAMNDYAHAIDESWYRELYDDYKSRCEKAIEYMKSIELEPDADMYMQIGEYNEYKYLLNILQNGSENK